jgi:hypothetical protein
MKAPSIFISYFDDGVCPVEGFFHASSLVVVVASGGGGRTIGWVDGYGGGGGWLVVRCRVRE